MPQHAHHDSIQEISLFTDEAMKILSRGESIDAYYVASSAYSACAFSKFYHISAVYKMKAGFQEYYTEVPHIKHAERAKINTNISAMWSIR